MKNCIAHISEDGRIHKLEDHLKGTAELAAEVTSASIQAIGSIWQIFAA